MDRPDAITEWRVKVVCRLCVTVGGSATPESGVRGSSWTRNEQLFYASDRAVFKILEIVLDEDSGELRDGVIHSVRSDTPIGTMRALARLPGMDFGMRRVKDTRLGGAGEVLHPEVYC